MISFGHKKVFISVIILCAFIVGLFHIAPQFLIWRQINNYEGSYIASQITGRGDVTQVYLPRAREVYDGHFPPFDLHKNLSENSATVLPALPPLVFSVFIYFSGGNINLAFLLALFSLTALIFLIFCFVGWIITKNRLWGIFLGFLGTLTPLPMHLPKVFSSLDNFITLFVKNFYPLVNTNLDKLFLDRFDDPLITYPFYLANLIAILLFWKKPRLSTGIIAGLFSGLLAYVYFHYWVYVSIVVGLIFVWSVLFEKSKDLQKFKHSFALFFAYFIASSLYLINYFKFRISSGAEDYTARVGLEHGRFIRLSNPYSVVFDYVFYIVLSFTIYAIFFRKENKNKAVLYWIFIAAMFICWNVQLITGVVPVSDHFWKAISPVILLILFDLIHSLLKNLKPREKRILNYAIIFLIVLLVSKKAVNALHFIKPESKFVGSGQSELSYSFNKNISQSWDWINLNLPKEPRIISDSLISSMYLLSYTSARPFLMTGFNTLSSNKEIAERFLISNKLFDVPKDVVYKRLVSSPLSDAVCWAECDRHDAFNKLKGSQHLFVMKKDENSADYRYIRKDFAEEIINKYQFTESKWENAESDYVYYGPWEKEFGIIDFSRKSDVKLVFKNSEVEMYKIIK